MLLDNGNDARTNSSSDIAWARAKFGIQDFFLAFCFFGAGLIFGCVYGNLLNFAENAMLPCCSNRNLRLGGMLLNKIYHPVTVSVGEKMTAH